MSTGDLNQAAPAARVASQAVSGWVEAGARLTPVIGEQTFLLLFARSVRLTTAAFPWIARNPDQPLLVAPPADALFADLERQLRGQTPEHAAEASLALLATFTGLLATFIGDNLTTRLMASIPLVLDPSEPPKGNSK